MKNKINPVYKKELKISNRSIRLSLTIFGYNLLLAAFGLLTFYYTFDTSGYQSVSFSNVLWVYTVIAVLELFMILFVVPAYTANSIAGERERQTLDILLTSTLKPEQIIIGKLLSSISNVMLLVFSSFPIMALVFAVGGIRFRDLLWFMVFAAITAVFIGSLGILFSTLFKKTVPATIFTYGAVVGLCLGTLIIVWIVYLLMRQAYSNAFYAGKVVGDYSFPGVGNLVLLLLVNPAVSMFSLVTNQYGSVQDFQSVISDTGKVSQWILHYWYYISMAVQLLLSVVFLKISARRLGRKS
jgi:ABC-type transport system involved in multi-copper enzyme maturation permease subunit